MNSNKPIIGIVLGYASTAAFSGMKVNSAYISAVEHAGGIPLLIPTLHDMGDMARFLSVVDGVLLPGGPDCSPCFYGEEPYRQIGQTCRLNDSFEIAFMRAAAAMGKPVLGICRGMQMINVAFGGTLYQDIASQTDTQICHHQGDTRRNEVTHSVEIQADSLLASILQQTQIDVNTFHHQCVKAVAEGFCPVGYAKDGIIEAIESNDEQIIAVQWHPEELESSMPEHARLFVHLIRKAEACKNN